MIDLAAPIDHHVRRFQIAMQHAFFVRRVQPRAEFARGLHRLVHRQPSDAAQQRAQILAVHELHGNVMQPLGHADVVDAAYVGMRHLARDPHFVIEASQRAIVGGGGFGQKLQRHRLAQRQVDGAVDFAHPAASQQSRHTIAPGNDGTRQKAAFIHAARGAQARPPRRRRFQTRQSPPKWHLAALRRMRKTGCLPRIRAYRLDIAP